MNSGSSRASCDILLLSLRRSGVPVTRMLHLPRHGLRLFCSCVVSPPAFSAFELLPLSPRAQGPATSSVSSLLTSERLAGGRLLCDGVSLSPAFSFRFPLRATVPAHTPPPVLTRRLLHPPEPSTASGGLANSVPVTCSANGRLSRAAQPDDASIPVCLALDVCCLFRR